MRNAIFLLLIPAVFCGASVAQNPPKPWTEWSKKDAEKILNDSAWGQTLTTGGSDTTSTAVITKTQGAGNESVNRTGESGETLGGAKPLNFHARFLTAKPVREAFARLAVLSTPNASKELTEQLQGFIDRDFGNYLVLALSIDSADSKLAGASNAALTRLNVEMLKDKVYLERKDGRRLTLIDYKPPTADGMGGKFIFERKLDGQPFLDTDSESVKFIANVSDRMKINIRFKVAAMMYGDKLEY
jgi:hypothetical protein